jgi:hypothetical protein
MELLTDRWVPSELVVFLVENRAIKTKLESADWEWNDEFDVDVGTHLCFVSAQSSGRTRASLPIVDRSC